MGFRRIGWALAEGWLAWLLMFTGMAMAVLPVMSQAMPAIATTTLTETVYRADGTAAGGTVLISWPSFSTWAGSSVPAGSTSATIGAGGSLTVQLVANAGSTPMGSYYTAIYHLDDGPVTREYWVVPVSSNPVAIASIRSTVLPATVAMQTVSKSYVDTAIAAAVTGHPLDTSPYVVKAGDTMLGPLVLPGDPTAPLQASDKSYVDTQVSGVSAGLNQKVSLQPQGSQTVVQPAGTQLAANSLNGVQYASQQVTGAGNNGIANAATSAACTSGCEVKAEQTYLSNEQPNLAALPNQTHVEDERGGGTVNSYNNPLPLLEDGVESAQTVTLVTTAPTAQVAATTHGGEIFANGLTVNVDALAGGSNVFPGQLQGTVPYYKTTYTGLQLNGSSNTLGQHVLFGEQQNCYAVGDCLLGGMFLQASGGYRDDADEGTHPFDRTFTEDPRVFAGSCSQGCTTGSTTLTVAVTANPGTQGEGRYLLNANPAKAITTGTILGPGGPNTRHPVAIFSGTAFPVSTFLESAQTIPTQSNNIEPGTVNVPIVTSGVPTGFATNTAALPATSGVACISDTTTGFIRPSNFETVAYTVLDASHLQMVLVRPHAVGATIAVGGLCGYGLEQKTDTLAGIRQVFPVIGSDSSTSLLYAGGQSSVVGLSGLTSSFLNTTLAVATISRTGNVVTATTVGATPFDLNGLTLNVTNVNDPSYNGNFTVTSTSTNTFTYANNGPDSTSAGGSLSYNNGSFGLYPMAEALSVFNPATKAVDGQMKLAANTVAWAPGDAVEMPHYFQMGVHEDTDFVTQFMPRPVGFPSAGIDYNGNTGAGLIGFRISNTDSASSYFGNGGTHTPPGMGFNLAGAWAKSFDLQAGDQAAFAVHCNSRGCGRWDSAYDLFELDSAGGQDRVAYSPQTSTMSFSLRGTQYVFSPQSLTAGTINATSISATSISATTVNGHFLGTVDASSLPLFGSSGGAHQQGAVPDPGATAGTSRYLREDGTWSTPPGSGAAQGTVVGLPQTANLIGEYLFTEGTGTLAHDTSGNGNDATLGAGALAPVWNSTGLTFAAGQNVSLPANLNAAQTALFALYITPLSDAAHHVSGNTLLLTNTLGNTAFQILLQAPYPGSNNNSIVDSAFGANIFRQGSVTASAFTTSGFHTLAVTLGTCGQTLDRIFFDGQEVTYTVQGCSAGVQTSGSLLLGDNPNAWVTGSGFPGEIYLAAFYSNALTADQVASASGIARNLVAARGVATAPLAAPLTAPALNVAGDSITFGFPNLTPYSALLNLSNPPTTGINNWGITGITMEAIEGSEDNRVGPLCLSSTGPAVYTIFAGTNDFLNIPQATPQSVFASLNGDIQKMKRAGCRVGVVTMLSRVTPNGGMASNGGATFDADKQAYNAFILNGAKAAGADFVVDVAANPNLGADGAYANATYFQADGVHPTQAGQQLIANAYSNAYNYTFGHNKANPNVVSAASYQMLSGDGAVSLTAASAQTVTLPDCTGPSGAVYYLNNSTGIAKSVVGGANQPINGLSSAVAIGPNSSLALFDVPNPETVSGCHWEY
jgi:lysophospholipase L1-like esterase